MAIPLPAGDFPQPTSLTSREADPMAWTVPKIVKYAADGAVDERYLIEAIRDVTTDAAIVRLIDLWFVLVDTEDDEDRTARADSFLHA